jgi:pre-rRNA-processing protein TSR4
MFKRFVEECPVNQVLYYSLGGSPIWISDEKQLDRSAPSCENCGGVRRFEFQIQPQLIYHLMKRLKGFPVDAAPFEWGVVSVYTCGNNCSDGPYYKEEFLYNQLEPAEWLEFDSRRKVDFTNDKQAGKEAPQISKNEDSDDGEWI